MRKIGTARTLTAIATAAAIAAATAALPPRAEAYRGWGGVAAGVAAGAIIGGALASRGYYGYGPYYGYAPYYYAPPPVVYEEPPVYVAPHPYYNGYSGQTHGGYYYGPQNCWPCY